MSTINYAVEVYTGTSVDDASWGLQAGVFRWVTGRPQYDGATVVPTWEDTTPNTAVWYEGFLTRNSMESPSRTVDITVSGDYGTNSGFAFSIYNDRLFWYFIQVNELWLTNRAVKLYCILDNVFYQIWDGVVSETPYSEQEFTFQCVDKFKTLHREMPDKTINETEHPYADQSDLGTPVPVVFGNVQYAKMLRFSNQKKEIPLLYTYGTSKSRCCGVNYIMDPVNNGTAYAIQIELVTNGVTIAADSLAGTYLQCVLGKGADKEKLVRILGNTATEFKKTHNVHSKNKTEVYKDISITKIGLEFPIYGTTAGINGGFAWTGHYYPTVSDDETWWFSVIQFTTELSCSGGSLEQYNRDERGNLLLYTYDKETKQYTLATDRIAEISSVDDLKITVSASAINEEGEISVTVPIPMVAKNVTNQVFLKDFELLSDLSMEGSMYVGIGDAADGYTVAGPALALVPVQGYDYSTVKEVYMAPAVHVKATSSSGHGKVAIQHLYGAVDIYGRAITIKDDSKWHATVTVVDDLDFAAYPDPGTHTTVIPRQYFALNDTPEKMANYNYNGNDVVREGGADSSDVTEPFVARYELCKVPDEILDMLKSNMLYYVSIQVKIKKGSSQVANFFRFEYRCSEIGFWGTKSLGSINEDLYVSVKGEKYDGVESGSVYGAFKLMLENYDKIPAATIDYGNLPATRSDWLVSRQLTQKRNSYDYIKELAEHSFVCVFPTRTGKRALSAWRENTTVAIDITQASIVRDSLKDLKNTSIATLYNAFSLSYNNNSVTNKMERVLTVNYVDEAAFPLSSDATWRTYVSGVNENSYQDAKALWEICHKAYLKSASVQKAPESATTLYWYADQNAAGSVPYISPGVDTANSPWLFLVNLCEWSTRQKAIVVFSLPITAANLALEMLQYITFRDELYTNGDSRPGWITGITHNVNSNTIQLETTLEPVELDTDITIVERGVFLNIDTIGEAVNQPNTVEETL